MSESQYFFLLCFLMLFYVPGRIVGRLYDCEWCLMVEVGSCLVTGRQLRAARVLAGLTQRGLGVALGVDERQIRFWERRAFSKPSRERLHPRIESVLRDHGVILFANPTPGARLAK